MKPWIVMGSSFAVLLAIGCDARAGESLSSYTGTAMATRTNAFLYRETHVLLARNGEAAEDVVLYTCNDGRPFARKIISYGDRLIPDFTLEDSSNGMQEGIRESGSEREIFFRPHAAAAEAARPLAAIGETAEVPLVADAGFDAFVRTHWQSLMQGDALGMSFLVPSRLGEFHFIVEHVKGDVLDGTAVELFRLRASGILGWVVPVINVYYGSADHELMRYTGLSDLRDAANDNLKADIVFRPSDRKAASRQMFESARRATLARCR